MKKKILAILISFLMGITAIPEVCLASDANEFAQVQDGEILQIENEITHINSAYDSVVQENDLLTVSEQEEAVLLASEASQSCTSIAEAGEELRKLLKERICNISINYVTSDEVDETLLEEIFDYAVGQTGNAAEGDYIRFQYAGWSAGYSGYNENGVNYLTLSYAVTYYTTKEQEEAVDAKVAAVLEKLHLDGKSDYQKIKAIYDYICKNVTYDYANLEDDSYQLKFTAYAALVNGTAVCQGYANLLYRLLLESGIDARIIEGTGNGENHAWNIAKAGESYYCLDATWDAGCETYSYFLKGKSNFSDHQPKEDYLSEAFTSVYTISDMDATVSDDGNGEGGDHQPAAVETWQDHAADAFSGGNGTKESPYQIDSAEELALLAKKVNEYDPNYNEACYILTNHIDLSDYEWMPIGNGTKNFDDSGDNNFFYGTFDGNDYSIKNLHIRSDLGIWYYGLFGGSSGNLKNIVLEGAEISVDSVDAGWQAENGMGAIIHVGGLAGCQQKLRNTAQIENCVVDADIEIKTLMSLNCGTVAGSLNYAGIVNTKATGKVECASKRAIWAGGFLGDIANETTVENCCFEGTVSSTNNGIITEFEDMDEGYSYLHYIGGFVGCAGRANRDITMRNCYAKAQVTGSSDKYVDAGGFAGVKEIVYGKACYQNLYCDATVYVDDVIGISETHNFISNNTILKHEDSADKVVIENCFYIEENKICVFQENNGDMSVTEDSVYEMDSIDLEDFMKNILKMDTSVWNLSSAQLPVLKIEEPFIAIGLEKVVPRNMEEQVHVKVKNGADISNLVWKSSDETIATVDETGKVHGMKQGTVTITVTGEGMSRSCEVSVTDCNYILSESREADCTEQGVKTYVCKDCGDSYTESIPAAGHQNIGIRNQKSPTCTEAGYTGDTYCKDCKEVIKQGNSIAAKGHVWDGGVIAREATYTEEGEIVYTCTVCNSTKKETITAKSVPGAGTILELSDASYKVTKAGTKNGTVEYLKTKSKSTTIKVPSTIKADGITYKVTSIASKAFWKNTKIKKVTIGNNVIKIGDKAFYGCKKLTAVTIGTGLTTIGKQAFYNDKALKTLTIKSTKLKSVGKQAFKGIHSQAKIKVPQKKLAAYQKKVLKNKGQGKKVRIVKL